MRPHSRQQVSSLTIETLSDLIFLLARNIKNVEDIVNKLIVSQSQKLLEVLWSLDNLIHFCMVVDQENIQYGMESILKVHADEYHS